MQQVLDSRGIDTSPEFVPNATTVLLPDVGAVTPAKNLKFQVNSLFSVRLGTRILIAEMTL